MVNFKHILCPTDLSPESDAALRYAVALAGAFETKLTVCHCRESIPPIDNTLQEQLRKRIKAYVKPWAESTGRHPPDYDEIIVEGDPVEWISRIAAERHVGLIVMRSRRRPKTAALLGSTAEAVSRTAPCPVLITHPDEREWIATDSSQIDLRKILVAQDFSIDSELALQLALSLSQEYQTEMHLLHVLQAGFATAAGNQPSEEEDSFHRAARLLHQSVSEEAYLWCKISQAIKVGQPYREILAYVEENEIDLICMGVHGAGFAMRALFGSNTDRVLRQAPCPVLIARPLRPATTGVQV